MAEPARVALATGASAGIGQYLAQALEKLDIAAELKSKTRLVSASGAQGPRVGTAAASGEAEIGRQPISELIEPESIDVVGPLPAELQTPDLVYIAGSPVFFRAADRGTSAHRLPGRSQSGGGVQGQGPETGLIRHPSGLDTSTIALCRLRR